MPVLIMVLILLVITVLLVIADKLLVSYGECAISIKEEDTEKKFSVQGGGTLLSALIENNVKIPASCAGRGSCGFCKVQLSSGGGQLLPTEEIFTSKEERRAGIRLACQVKVKEDLEMRIPDLLTSVKSMVKNGTIDTKLKWKFMKNVAPVIMEKKKLKKLDHSDRDKVDEIIERHQDKEGAIMPVLLGVNETFNYLPEPVLSHISQEMDVPLSTVLRIATFYNTFSLKPRGKYIITICTGTACHVKGAADIVSAFEEQLGLNAGETTEDMHFTLDAVRCIGCCGLAPVLTINEDVHGLMTPKKVPELIGKYKER